MYLGLDLAGSPKNPTGWFSLPARKHGVVFSDEEIMEVCRNARVIAIDAPLSMPEDWFRDCDRELFALGFRPLSPKLRGMQPLVERAMKLAEKLRGKGHEVIEVHAKASRAIIGLEKDWLEKEFGKLTEDEIDALACSMTAMVYEKGKFRAIGRDCRIILPMP